MKKILMILAFEFLMISGALAGGFDDLGFSARSVSMGGAGIAVPGSPYSIFYNPANMYSAKNMSFYTSYANLFPGVDDDNINYITLSGIVPISFLGTIGFGGTFLNTDLWKEYTLSGSYSYEVFDGFAAGGTIKLLGWSASAAPGEAAMSYKGFTFDAGVIYTCRNVLPDFDIRAAVSARNLNQPAISSGGSVESSKLPLILGAGISFVSNTYDYIFTTDVLKEKDVYSIRTGAEFLGYRGLLFQLQTEFFIRIGYHDILDSKFAEEKGVTGGFGLRVDNYRFDYGYEFPLVLQDLGGIHRLSFSFNL